MPKKGSDRGIYQRGDSPYWWIRYSPGRGQRVRYESTGTADRAEALAILEERRVAARHGTLPVRLRPATVAELAEEYLAQRSGRSWMTQRTCMRSWTDVLGPRQVSSLRALDFERYVSSLRARLASSSAHRWYSAVKAALRAGRRWGMVSAAVVEAAESVAPIRVDRPVDRYLARETWPALLAACSDRLRPLVTVALHTGLREAELLALEWADVDYRHRRLTVRLGKGGKGRVVDLDATAIKALRSVVRPIAGGLVFLRQATGGKLARIPRKAYLAAQAAAGISPPFRVHDLRHAFAAAIVAEGVPLPEVQRLMGHSSIEMTMRYVHVAPASGAAAVAVLDRQPREASRAKAS